MRPSQTRTPTKPEPAHDSPARAEALKTKVYPRREPLVHSFGNRGEGEVGDAALFEPRLGADGMPYIGMKVSKGDPLCAIVDESTGRHTIKRHKASEPAIVEEVRLIASDGAAATCDKASIKLRFNRNPVPGDKFSSRHGQKGVMSRLWPSEDMPFTESGISPDILFNPHGFPSRMTIGMLLETMAGKAGALHAVTQDGTPFRFSEQQSAVDHFGEQLRAAGYNYHGTEIHASRPSTPYSPPLQVRAKGPINQLTHQPVHGRKVHGGIRLGEMERDALLAHGASFLVQESRGVPKPEIRKRRKVGGGEGQGLVVESVVERGCERCGGGKFRHSASQERLLHCSDEAKTLVCAKCSSLLSTMRLPARGGAGGTPVSHAEQRAAYCRSCESGEDVHTITVPYVLQYLTNELAAMNIKTQLRLSQRR
ncbi:MAG: hypothetical protein SGPRY_010377 [Prymnesium sp.]